MSVGYATIDDIKAANKKVGHSWFSADTMKEHGSKVETEVIGGFYFVESGHCNLGDPSSGRVYRIAAAAPDGTIHYLAGGETFPSVDGARGYLETVIGS